MNEKQKEYLAKFIQEKSYEGEREPEWTPAKVVNTSDLKTLVENILKLI